jgi:mono/diheme cytochrome c family protein
MTNKLSMLVATAALGALLAAGCSKSADSTSSSESTTAASGTASSEPSAASSGAMSSGATAASVASAGDPAKGSAIFAANCAGCHGAGGAGGGVGPSLHGEKNRKNTSAAIAWIKNPAPPMPKLYPSPLSEKDVSDVAAYVESL